MVVSRVANPLDGKLRVTRAHRPAHDVLHTAIRAGERAATRGVERSHGGIDEAREITLVDRRQLHIGDRWHQDLARAGLGANAGGDAVVQLQRAAQVVVQQLHPSAFGLAHHSGHSTTVEKRARLGVPADVEAAHDHRKTNGHELQRQVPAARILVGLHAS